MRTRFFAILLAIFTCAHAHAATPFVVTPAPPIWIEDMTSPEIRAALNDGKTTIIIPTGGTEQNGQHLSLGKHNFILKYTAMEIARRLGNALAAPIMQYVPEGDIHPPAGHMKFAGTISLKPETFAAVLEDTARSFKEHGFKTICFVGEHGGSQPVQQAVAAKLSAEWQGEGVRVIHVGAYYDSQANGQVAWAQKMDVKEPDIEAHAGLADTAEMLSVNPKGVRQNLRAAHTAADMDKLGAGGSSLGATREMGAMFLELKVRAAVKQIQEATR